jgi:transcriptional regulator with XRE-family HTH domain
MSPTKRSGDSIARRRPTAKRIRAARAFSGLERPAFAKASGIGVERLNYLENGKGDPSPEEEDAIQRAAGVPFSFLRHGFEADDGTGTDQLDRRLGQLGATVAELREDVRTAKAAREDLEQRLVELSADLEGRLLTRVGEELERRLRQPPEDSRLREAGGSAR